MQTLFDTCYKDSIAFIILKFICYNPVLIIISAVACIDLIIAINYPIIYTDGSALTFITFFIACLVSAIPTGILVINFDNNYTFTDLKYFFELNLKRTIEDESNN